MTAIMRRQIWPVEALEPRVLLAAAFPGITLDPVLQPKFVNPLPNPLDPGFIYQPTTPGGSDYEIGMYEKAQWLGLVNPADGVTPLMTTVWGYGTSELTASYPGRSFEVRRDQPITVQYTNNLPIDPVDGHLVPVDTSVHWAFTHNQLDLKTHGVPVVPHLHGGHTDWRSDGTPEAWFTPGYANLGPDITEGFYVNGEWQKHNGPTPFTYDNSQEAATLWYHDHALGITRLNVYAGLAGFYIVRDTVDYALANPGFGDTGIPGVGLNIPKGPYEIPMVIQDRMFDLNGQLYYPAQPPVGSTAAHPSILPEFFGDHILVNGQTWPFQDVEPRKYRFRLLNGSDSRVYNFSLSSGQAFVQIGSDTGLLNAPVAMNQLTLAPGERADVILDFSAFAGQTITLRNNAKTPYPKGAPVNTQTTGQIMQFRVVKPLSGPDTSVIPATLRPAPITPLVATNPNAVRKLALYEMMDPAGRMQPMLGTVSATPVAGQSGPLMWMDQITELLKPGDTEVWEIYNNTPDTHPIHLHLVSFQVVSRQKFNATVNPMTRAMTNIRLSGQPQPPAANEAGWKDTVRMNPGEVTRIIATFDREGMYVWHCHILSHEDHEMMRPVFVGVAAPQWPRMPMMAPMASTMSGGTVSVPTVKVFSDTQVSALLTEQPALLA